MRRIKCTNCTKGSYMLVRTPSRALFYAVRNYLTVLFIYLPK